MSVISPTVSNYRNIAARAEEFIAAARVKHSDKYDYRDVPFQFTNAHNPVTIICPEHGPFPQAPHEHRRGQGCPDCSGRKNSGTSVRATRFIVKARAVHGDRYDYADVEFQDQRTPVNIRCRIHGLFPQRPTNHLAGRGCPDCAATERSVSLRAAASSRTLPRRGTDGMFRPDGNASTARR